LFVVALNLVSVVSCNTLIREWCVSVSEREREREREILVCIVPYMFEFKQVAVWRESER